MGQRINIQYSIDIDDLQDEVDRLFNKSLNKLNNLSKLAFDNPLSLGASQGIDDIRAGLADVDATLHDLQGIINGYISYKTKSEPLKDDSEVDKYEEPTQTEYSF
tara:strand:+ start:239 stop:553 length:315 start_codon:yes stop_codon:yes gene_type:complete